MHHVDSLLSDLIDGVEINHRVCVMLGREISRAVQVVCFFSFDETCVVVNHVYGYTDRSAVFLSKHPEATADFCVPCSNVDFDFLIRDSLLAECLLEYLVQTFVRTHGRMINVKLNSLHCSTGSRNRQKSKERERTSFFFDF